MDVVEADAVQQLQHVAHARHRLEEFQRLFHRHVEHVGDRLVAEQHLQRLAVVALALADVAGDVDVGQEVHLNLDHAVALAGLAAAALDVEREAAGLVAARFRLRKCGEPFADRRERAGVGRRIRARRAADRRLVDVDDLVDVLEPLDAVVRRGADRYAVQLARHRVVQRIDQQRGLAATGDAGGGKSTLLIDTLYNAVARKLNGASLSAAAHDRIEGLEHIDKIIDIDQSPIGRTPRSNPATYTGAFTPIREWFAVLPESKA